MFDIIYQPIKKACSFIAPNFQSYREKDFSNMGTFFSILFCFVIISIMEFTPYNWIAQLVEPLHWNYDSLHNM